MELNRSPKQRAATFILALLLYTASIAAEPPASLFAFGLCGVFLSYAIWPDPPDFNGEG
jgi:hypothetical protein